MKVAIIGSGPLALELGIKLFLEEASVTIFSKGEVGGAIRGLKDHLEDSILGESFQNITTPEGWRIIAKDPPDLVPTIKAYWENYLGPLAEKLEALNLIKKGEVLRVKKCFISPHEDKRLRDLFRVFYTVNPKESILKSIEENPEVFESLGKDVLNSLNEKMEFFEDFDLVVDARGVISNPLPMGSSQGEALNESVIAKSAPVYYGLKGLEKLEEIKSTSKTILIVGSGDTSATYLSLLKTWMFGERDRKVFLVTKENQPFNSVKNPRILENIKNLFNEIQEEYEKRVEVFQSEINHWKELEDYVKAKMAKPSEPFKRLEIFTESTISSLDRLLDRTNLFVTVDSYKEVRTLAIDSIIVTTGFKIDSSIFKGLHMDFDYGEKTSKKVLHSEPGIYSLGPIIKENRYNLRDGLEQIPIIFENMLTFFSKIK